VDEAQRSDFGDSEPEDAWHPEDAIPEQVRNISLRVALLDRGPRLPPGKHVRDVLDGLIRRVQAALDERDLNARQQHRANQALEDIEFVLLRLVATDG